MDQNQKPYITYECRDGIATITLDRPEKLNAFNDDMVRELMSVFHRFDLDPEANVAILCGTGRAFSSGADVRQRQMKSREELERGGGPSASDAKGSDILARSVNWKPVVAAVHGYALGMGTALAFESDLCVAEAGTRFQITETPRGLSTGSKIWAVMSFRGLGSFATEVTLTGRYFTAEEAHAAGVIDRLAPTGTYMDVARDLATRIAKLPPLAARGIVQTRRWAMIDARREADRYSSLNKLYLTEDFAEAARAFGEKRPAGPFKGR